MVICTQYLPTATANIILFICLREPMDLSRGCTCDSREMGKFGKQCSHRIETIQIQIYLFHPIANK